MSPPTHPPAVERRATPRGGPLRPLYNLLYRLLRWIGAHVQGFYKAVGVFLIIGLVVVLIASVFLWSSRHHYSAALLWVSMLGAGFVNAALKVSFNRPRPDVFPWRTQHVGLASFPSGHAMTSIVVYGTLAFLIARLAPTRFLRRLTWTLAILVILLIGWSRLYLGVHYPSDVLAGFVMGTAWAVICGLGIEAVRYFRSRRPMVVVEEKDLETGGPVAPPNPV